MGFFSKLFAATPEPERVVVDPVLGRLEWSEDDEGWAGAFNGLAFQIGYTRASVPDAELVGRAREVLRNRERLDAEVAAAKREFLAGAGAKAAEVYRAEVESLTIEQASFWPKERIFVSLDGGDDFRAWRLEFEGGKRLGLGFDS